MGPKTVLLLVHLLTLVMTALGRAPAQGRRGSTAAQDVRVVGAEARAARQKSASLRPCGDGNPLELGDAHEDDIKLARSAANMRLGLTNLSKLWPNREMPYILHTEDYNERQLRRLQRAFNKFNENGCLLIVPYNKRKHKDYIRIKNTNVGCYGDLGRQGGEQILDLEAPKCMLMRTIVHLFMHLAGFGHEHNHPLRDNYVDIIWENVRPDKMKNFRKYKWTEATDFGLGYDYGSITHYSTKTFSKNNQSTIIAKDKNANSYMGRRKHMSSKDIMKIKRQYHCSPVARK